jgi:TRAP-type C4-dicarboxylate transport system substrate-binding protein
MEYWEQFPDDIKEPLDKELKKVGLWKRKHIEK